MSRVNWSENNIDDACRRIAGEQQVKPGKLSKHKYNAKPKVYNGKKYPSTKEANFRRDLDIAANADDPNLRPVEIKEQVIYVLSIDGILICRYILDFWIRYASGRLRFVDVKGQKKGVVYQFFKTKKALMKICHGIEVEEV